MSDADLVRAVAVEVMGWSGTRYQWFPTKSWDDAMMVVAWMRGKGCAWLIRDYGGKLGEVQIGDEYVGFDPGDHDSIRRAILEAALAEVREGGA